MKDNRKEKKVKSKKKILLIIILLLLLLIPFSCTMMKKGNDNSTSKDNYIENKLEEDNDEEIDDYIFEDEEILDEDIITDEVVELDESDWKSSYSYKKYYTNYTNNSNSNNNTQNGNSNSNSNNNIKDLVASVSYSTDSLTYKTVVATITSNKELYPVDGWTLSEDKKTLTKEYSSNTEEEITVKDKDGEIKKLVVSIKNISSEEEVKTGSDGEFEYIVLDSGEIQLTRYLGSKTALTIPAEYDGYTVYSVGNPNSEGATNPKYAYNIFGENTTTNTTIKSLTIEKGIKKVEDGSFAGCSGLTGNINVPDGVTEIGSFAFSNCTGLKGNLILPNTLSKILFGAFYNCTGLTGNLIIPEGVIEIENTAFGNCKGFKGNLILPSTLKIIGRTAFANCSGLTGDLVIPEGVEIIAAGAFQNCSGFNGELSLPSSLKEIGEYAFNKCSKLTGNIIIPEGIKSIESSTFQNCSSLNGKLILPSTLESIKNFAFNECSGLTGNIVIPEGVTTIGAAAFQHCSGFNGKLSLPSTLESIGDYAFNHCEFLTNTTITIPKSVKLIGSSATEGTHIFYNAASRHITEFVVEEGNEYFKAVDGVLFTKDGTRLIQYPTSKPGNVYEIPEGVTILDPLSFNRAGAASAWCSAPDGGLRTVIIPDSLNVVKGNTLQLSNALYTYAGVTNIEVKETNPNYKSIDGILYSKDGTILYTVPVARKGIIDIEEGVTDLKGVFVYPSSRSSQIINIPSTVTYISSTELSNLKTMGPTKVIFAEGCIYQFDDSGNIVKIS